VVNKNKRIIAGKTIIMGPMELMMDFKWKTIIINIKVIKEMESHLNMKIITIMGI
jgi:hypothetical protein